MPSGLELEGSSTKEFTIHSCTAPTEGDEEADRYGRDDGKLFVSDQAVQAIADEKFLHVKACVQTNTLEDISPTLDEL